MSSFEHQNIIKLYYSFDNIDYYFIAMELMRGGTLRDFITASYADDKRHYFLRDSECAEIMTGVVEGVEYLHSKSIIHKDLKPDNIMFALQGDLSSIKLGDFGFSKETEYRSNEYCGTYIYMAPEIIKKKPYTEKIDIWALGIIMYIMGSGGEHPIIEGKWRERLSRRNCYRSERLVGLLIRIFQCK